MSVLPEQHYHRGDGKPGRRNAPPCGCDTPTTYTRPVSAYALLRERADSYARDARKFRDAGELGRPIISAGDDARWAASYQVIADELRKVAASIGQDR